MKRRGLRRVSAKRAAEQEVRDDVRRAALERDRHCIAAGVVTEVACGGPADVDEWDLRSAGGSHLDVDNCYVLCRNHHDWKHTHPIEAAHYGLRPYPAGHVDPEATDWCLGARLRAERPPEGE